MAINISDVQSKNPLYAKYLQLGDGSGNRNGEVDTLDEARRAALAFNSNEPTKEYKRFILYLSGWGFNVLTANYLFELAEEVKSSRAIILDVSNNGKIIITIKNEPPFITEFPEPEAGVISKDALDHGKLHFILKGIPKGMESPQLISIEFCNKYDYPTARHIVFIEETDKAHNLNIPAGTKRINFSGPYHLNEVKVELSDVKIIK